MKTCHVILLLSMIAVSAIAEVHGAQLLYLASQQDKKIVAYSLNPKSGGLTEKFQVELPGNPGPLAFSPDQGFVYAAMTGLSDGRAGVATLKRADNGLLDLRATATITSRAPYIRADKTGRYLMAAHYGAGEVTVYRIVDGICTDELLDQKATNRTAHCIEIDPSGRFVYVPHTAPNKVYQFRLDTTTGKLTPNDPPFAEGPSMNHDFHAPRHYAHHPTLRIAYTSNESGGGITAWKFNADRGTLSRLQTLSTLPPDYNGKSAAADIHITPDGRFAYVSNRDVTKRPPGEAQQDSIAGLSLDPRTGRMKLIGHFPTAVLPRSFCIDLTGRFVYSAGQRSSNLFAYRIDQKTGKLVQLATYATAGVPIWVMCGHTAQSPD